MCTDVLYKIWNSCKCFLWDVPETLRNSSALVTESVSIFQNLVSWKLLENINCGISLDRTNVKLRNIPVIT